jgi:3-dehydroquinate synthase
VPTSVVAMADAAVGGKTAINHPRGKNLLGAFHAPRLVWADVATLSSLPPRDFVAGLAEVWKAGVVGDPSILAMLRGGVPGEGDALEELLACAIRVKARLVEEDERDEGVRRALNYGHTVGHALETVLGPDVMRHGEAVAIGMGVAAELARARGLVGAAFVARQDADLARLTLPTRVPRSADGTRVLEVVGADKKRRAGAMHTWVLPHEGGGVRIVEDVTSAEIEAALDARAAGR